VHLTRLSGLGVAAAASLAMIAAGLAPTVAQASAQGVRAAALGGRAAAPTGGAAAPAGAASGVTYYTGTPGVARLLPRRVVVTSGPARPFPRGARRLPSGHFSTAEAVPRAQASTAAAAATNSALVNVNGVSSLDSQVTNYNLKFEPPDQGLCEGNGVVLEAVNSAYRFYRMNGTSLRGPFNINDLFNVGGKEFTSDPRCWFDPSTQTWFATVLFLNDTSTVGSELIAVHHGTSPLGLWNEYSIDATDLGGRGCPCFGDQPRIGIDQNNLYITADEFSIKGPQFDGAELWAIPKAQLVAGAAQIHFEHFAHLQIAGQLTLAPQPALTTETPNAEYFLSSLDFGGNGDHRIGVWALTKRNQVAAGTAVLSSVVINSEAYANPPKAPQQGSTSTLDSGDDRMQQTEFAGGTVWGEMTTAVQPAGDSAVRAGGAWFQVKPALGPAGITGASIVRQGYIASAGRYLLYPAVQPDAAGNAAVVFTVTSGSMFPSAGYATLTAGGSNFGPPVVAAPGSGPYFLHSTRWGDYSFAVPDSSSDAAWLATEYIPPLSSQTTNGRQNWGTRLFKVPLG
jgi:hypothetical protein